jgi:hypothetical protein
MGASMKLFGRFLLCFASFAVSIVSISQPAAGQTTTKYEVDGDTLYRVTKQTVPRPISKTEWDEHQQTVYREQYNTEWQTNYRTYMTPVTEYRQELYLANRWNPLATPYWAYRYVPVTRWEVRQEPYSVPVAQRSLVPEQRTVHVPRTTTQIAMDEHISRVAVGPAASSGTLSTNPTAVARRDFIGGTKLENDPPSVGWQPANGGTVRR